MSKFIFITGGVVSSLGKGISGSSIAKLLRLNGLKVNMIKCDPYINVDAGTMNPYQHGEVYVTADGAETDLDLGYYERFLEIEMTQHNNVTAGSIYQKVIEKERKGQFLGATVQVIPHITNEIKSRFEKFAKDVDVTLIEIGGTVGDIESLPFLEAARQMRLDHPNEVCYVHVTLIPYIASSDELKTKPTQHSVNTLRAIGITPNIIICRTGYSLTKEIKNKISLFCSVPVEAVIQAKDAPSIYDVPENLRAQGITEQIFSTLGIKAKGNTFSKWKAFIKKIHSLNKTVTIAVAGKYTQYKDAYKSIGEALMHGGFASNTKVNIDYVNVEDKDFEQRLHKADGILIPGGFGERGICGKIKAANIARTTKKPIFGICLGMQCIVIEAARNMLAMTSAHSTEFKPHTKYPVIDLIEEQRSIKSKGGTMRLGNYKADLKLNSNAHKIYKKTSVLERHRHRYEMNPKFIEQFAKKGLMVTGIYKKRNLPEIVELKNHPWFIGVQFHPEYKSKPTNPHPLFKSFVAACIKYSSSRK